MDEMKLLRDRAEAQPAPGPEVIASALDRLHAAARRPSRPWHSIRLSRSAVAVLVVATVATVATVAVAGVTSVALRNSGSRTEKLTIADMDGSLLPPWREGDPEIAVFLCGDDSPYVNCGGGGIPEDDGEGPPPDPIGGGKAVTTQQMAAVEQALRAMPQVETVTFVSRRESHDRFSHRYPKAAAAVPVDSMPQSFEMKLKPDVEWQPVVDSAADLAGVASVVNRKCMFETFLEKLVTNSDQCRSA